MTSSGVASRYASLSILLWISVLVLFTLRYRHDARAWIVGFVVTALAFASGQPTLTAMSESGLNQNELAIAMRLGLANGYLYAPRPPRRSRCSSRIRHTRLRRATTRIAGWSASESTADIGACSRARDGRPPRSLRAGLSIAQSVRMSGWFGSREGRRSKCVVITDPRSASSARARSATTAGRRRGDTDRRHRPRIRRRRAQRRTTSTRPSPIVDGEESRPV